MLTSFSVMKLFEISLSDMELFETNLSEMKLFETSFSVMKLITEDIFQYFRGRNLGEGMEQFEE